MPDIRCITCGERIYIDLISVPSYVGEVGCPNPNCSEKMHVSISDIGTHVERIYPSFDELKGILDQLGPVEKQSIQEASLSFGVGAHTASEMMALRSLEGLLRMIYNVEETLGNLLDRLENDPNLTELTGVFSYFRYVRNRVAHPDKISSKLEAESTFQMMKRLILEIFEKLWDR